MGDHSNTPPPLDDLVPGNSQGTRFEIDKSGFTPISGDPSESECITVHVQGETLTIDRKTTAGDIKDQIGADPDSLLATRMGNDIGVFNDNDRVADSVDEVDEFVSENSELLGRVLACGNDEARAYAWALVANSGGPTRVDDVEEQLGRIRRDLETG